MNPISAFLKKDTFPTFTGSVLIDSEHSSMHARLTHVHDDYMELFYVYEGNGQYLVDNRSYDIKAGDIVVCNGGVLHGELPASKRRVHSYSVAIKNVQFVGLPPNCLVQDGRDPVVSCGQLSGQIGEIFQLAYTLTASPGPATLEIQNSLCNALLLFTYQLLNNSKEAIALTVPAEKNDSFKQIRKYLDLHYCEPITLDSVAEELHLNKYYISHCFKKHLNISPMQYVMNRRIGESQSLLMKTSLPISEIAERLCFTDPSHFISQFRRIVGQTPGEYRKYFSKG